jgi:hypothetical protein
MSQSLTLKVEGLFTSPNPFSSAPDGGLLVADDVSIDQPNLATPRRGFIDWTTLPLTTDRLTRLDYYQGSTDSKGYMVGTWSNGKWGYAGASTWTSFAGTFNDPDPVMARCRFFQTSKNLYLLTSSGVYKTASVENDPPRLAGVPRGLDVQLTFSSSANQWFGWNTQGTFTASTTNSSATLTFPGSLSLPAVSVGNYLSGTNIPASTTVTAITQPAVAANTTVASTTVGNTTFTVASAAGIANGQFVQDYAGTTFATGTTVMGVSGTTITVSSPIRLTNASTIGVSFTTPGSFTMSNTATGTNSSVTVTYGFGAQVAYRVVWGYTDANTNLLLGAPSQWVSITNTNAGNGTVTVNTTIPAGITTAYFYQIYRSPQTASGSVVPGDTMQLVYQGNPSSSDISNGFISVTDVQPDSLRGQALYSGTDQQTIAQAYTQPPVCSDACTFYGYTLYAAPKFPHSLTLTFLGIGSPSGVQVGDTVTIGGITFTAGNSQNVGTNTFQVVTSGTPAQNITSTVNSFLQVVNQSATSTVYAYLISGPTDLPGQIQLTVRSPGGAQFAVTASAHGTAYSPALPTSGTTVSSTSASYPNCVLPSVQNLPEAAPLANLLSPIGSATAPIRRIIPLRDRVAILKDDGAFFITGTTLSSFVTLPIDYTTQIVAPDSAVVLNNEVWALCTTGIVAIADTGVKQESFKNVNDFFTKLFGQAYSTVQQYAFGIGYQSDHKYILLIPSAAGSPNSQALVYNVFTSAWTRWTRQESVGFINSSDGLLYIGNSQTNQVLKERKAGDYTDFIDESSASPNITAIDQTGYIITLDSLTNINVGDLLYQSSSIASPILSINSSNFTVTVRDLVSWTVAGATIYPSIKPNLQWKPQANGNPGLLRQYSEGDVLFTVARFTNAMVSFFTDISQSTDSVPLTSSSATPWGMFVWGGAGIPWGDITRPKPIRFVVPTNDQVCSQINPSFSSQEAWATWAISGMNLVYQDIGEELSA